MKYVTKRSVSGVYLRWHRWPSEQGVGTMWMNTTETKGATLNNVLGWCVECIGIEDNQDKGLIVQCRPIEDGKPD